MLSTNTNECADKKKHYNAIMLTSNDKKRLKIWTQYNDWEHTDFIVGVDSFDDIQIANSESNGFWYFKNTKKSLIKRFVLENSVHVEKACTITLIKKPNGKFTPRFDFQIWNTTKKAFEKLNKETVDENLLKARVNLDSCHENFFDLLSYIINIRGIDFDSSSYAILDPDKAIIADENKVAYFLKLKNKEEVEKVEEIRNLLNEGGVSDDIIRQARADTRKGDVGEFKRLLEYKNYWRNYLDENKHEMKGEGEEAVWHHFLKKNRWIIGLNVEVCFIRDLLDEVNLGATDTTGAGSPVADFLGISDYTILVELKKPSTRIFTNKKKIGTSRANTWSFSDHFIDGVSQCLAQKTEWEKEHKGKDVIDDKGNIVDQVLRRTVDPNSIFLIGNKSREIPESNRDKEVIMKRETLQRFRRNNRNVDIISYDELYERAYFIVYDKKPEPLFFKDDETE